MKPVILCLAALILAACSKPEPPAPQLADLPDPPAEWLAAAPPLPDVPKCNQTARVARLACRGAYDEQTRGQYVALANRHTAVAGWVRVAKSRAKSRPVKQAALAADL